MAFVVIIGRRAQADIANTVAGTGWPSPAAANRWRMNLLSAVIPKLEADPKRYPQSDDAARLGFDLREMLYGRRRHIYRVLFTIDGNTVNVLRVRHAAQDRLTEDDL